jgi:dienelactone hydrolase
MKRTRTWWYAIGFSMAASMLGGCAAPLSLARDDSAVVLARQQLNAPDPSTKGRFAVRTLYYGSGTDRQRAVYRDSVTLKTATVNGAAFATAPDPKQGRIRKKFWGFDFTKLPVNGRVWYPDAPGPFPLVLVVHGNHDMKQFSDPGYAYLGELLASRGFIVASVDQNFLNGNIRGENDARGWMLLKHLQAWQGFNDAPTSPLKGMVDMHQIALMGHSRGGEAVAVAGAFNRLAHYPDNATVTFNFNFDIKSLVAIAPVDGQYRPADKPTPVANYNYLLVHGSHDGDVSTFSGLAQYERVRFTDGQPWFKAAVSVYRANHGQWNSTWGRLDGGPRSARSLDTRGLISEADQRKFAEVYVTAFLESTLRGRVEYLPMFRDHRVIGAWLPKTLYTTRFQESNFRVAGDFEEDVDVTSGSVPGVTFSGDSLAVWKESPVPFRSRGATQAHSAVTIGWNNRIAGNDSTKVGAPAAFAMTVSDSLRSAWRVGAASSLVFSLSPTDAKPGPRAAARDTVKPADSTAPSRKKAAAKTPTAKRTKPDTVPIDLSVEITDALGRSASVPLSAYGVIRRPLEAYVYRRAGRDKQRFATVYEIVLQTYVLPLADFAKVAPGFDPSRVTRVRWRFDRTPAGTVLLDNIGFSTMRPGFDLSSEGASR